MWGESPLFAPLDQTHSPLMVMRALSHLMLRSRQTRGWNFLVEIPSHRSPGALGAPHQKVPKRLSDHNKVMPLW